MARRILYKDNSLSESGNPLPGYKFVGYDGLTFSQLDSDGNIISITGTGSSGDNFTSLTTGNITITDGASDGYVLTSDSSGVAYWTASVGVSGTSGTSGTSGAAGAAGSSGTSGAAGAAGSSGTSGISGFGGTGTTDYITKWTGSSTIGNSIIRENGSNISIGITPSTLLNYFTINDTRSINSSFYKEALTVNSSSATFSRGIYVSMSSTKNGTGIYVENKTGSGDIVTGIASLMSGSDGSHSNQRNTITGGSLTSPAGGINTNTSNWIHNDYKRTFSGLTNIDNWNYGEGNGLYGINTNMGGTAVGVYGEKIQIYSTATDTIYGVNVIISGSSSDSSTGVYIETTHPVNNSKSYGIVVKSGKSVFNDGSNSYSDFQIKGDTDMYLLYADVSSDSIGIGTIPDSRAILELSSTTKGFLPPRMTADQANAAFGTQSSAPEGMLVYITATSSDPSVAACFYTIGWFGRLTTTFGNPVGWVQLSWQILS
jgi:hypothetical protein